MPIQAFTTLQVRRLTGLTERMLRYWEETGVYAASYIDDRPHTPYRRFYDFRDLVSLKTLALLRTRYKIKLDDLRKTGDFLRDHVDRPWSEIVFGVFGRTVVFRLPGGKEWMTAIPPGQTVIQIAVDEIAKGAEQAAAELGKRPPEALGRIVRHRHVLGNAWRLDGTRIPTSAVWNLTEAGYDLPAVIDAYPDLKPADVKAALEHERKLRDRPAA